MVERAASRSVAWAAAAATLVLVGVGAQRAGGARAMAVPDVRGHVGLVARPLAVRACAPLTTETIEAGRKIFTGEGNCYTCHGADAKGTALAPSLHEHKWLNIDGSYASIANLVTTGVPHPKEHPAPMPPKGGANLSDHQVCEVAAYVYSLTHPR